MSLFRRKPQPPPSVLKPGEPWQQTAAGDTEPQQIATLGEPIRIRIGHSYHVQFTAELGQRNAAFVKRAMTPLNRFFPWADSFAIVPEPGFEAIHSWNALPLLTRRPYILTFEDYMPRTPDDRKIRWLERSLRNRLLDSRCVALVATSNYAHRQFLAQHRGFAGLPDLLAKTEILYPAVQPRRTRPKMLSDTLRLLFVGRDFMRKGGPAVLRAHAKLRELGVPVETTIVSSLHWSAKDYIGPPDPQYVAQAHAQIDQPGVIHYHSLPSPAVRALMDAADFLVFPTFHDTFGFVTLEAFAGGTPVIASNTCVLPELIDEAGNGFLLPFENDAEVGKWRWLYQGSQPGYLDAYEDATAAMTTALVERLADVWQDHARFKNLSAGALAAAHDRFHPDIARRRLEMLYERFRMR